MFSTNEMENYKKNISEEEIKDKIINLFFNLSRENKKEIGDLYKEVLENVIEKLEDVENPQKDTYIPIFIVLYKIIGYTRDIILGRGERDLSYVFLLHFHKHFPIQAMICLHSFTTATGKEVVPYGSWKDICNFCQYVKDELLKSSRNDNQRDIKNIENHPAIMTAIGIMNDQIDKDKNAWNNEMYKYLYNKKHNPMCVMQRPKGRDIMSLAIKWCPRETSKYGWIYNKMVQQWYHSISPHILKTAITPESFEKAMKKCKMNYRKMISALNRELETVEVYQCSHNWSNINPQNVPINTMMKQKNAFLNVTNNMKPRSRTFNSEDRKTCSQKFEMFFKLCENSSPDIKNQKVGINNSNALSMDFFAKKAIEYINQKEDTENEKLSKMIQLLNEQWIEFTNDIQCEDCIPMIYKSYYMSKSYLALACLLAKNTKAVLVMRDVPIWLNLSNCNGFVEMIDTIYHNCYEIPHVLEKQTVEESFKFLSNSYENMLNGVDNFNELITGQDLNTNKKPIKLFILSNKDITNTIENSSQFVNKMDQFKIIYWNLSEKIINIKGKSSMLIVSGVSKSLIKHLTNFTFNDYYNMLCHILKHPRYDNLIPMTCGKYFIDEKK